MKLDWLSLSPETKRKIRNSQNQESHRNSAPSFLCWHPRSSMNPYLKSHGWTDKLNYSPSPLSPSSCPLMQEVNLTTLSNLTFFHGFFIFWPLFSQSSTTIEVITGVFLSHLLFSGWLEVCSIVCSNSSASSFLQMFLKQSMESLFLKNFWLFQNLKLMNSVLKFTVSSSVPSASIAWQPYTYWLLYEMKIMFITFPFIFHFISMWIQFHFQ